MDFRLRQQETRRVLHGPGQSPEAMQQRMYLRGGHPALCHVGRPESARSVEIDRATKLELQTAAAGIQPRLCAGAEQAGGHTG